MLNDWSDRPNGEEVAPPDHWPGTSRWKRALSAALMIAAIVFMFWSIKDAFD